MAKDPICGMDVAEEGAKFMLHFEQETLYFCSAQCKDKYVGQTGMETKAARKGPIRRLLEKIAKGTERSFGGKPPQCH